ncbi:MAG: hypothetical protein ACRD41_08995, partial [Candidatus Acidiferrales bacterium]
METASISEHPSSEVHALPPTRDLVASLLTLSENVSDIFLSPMRGPEVRVYGRILKADTPALGMLLPDDTRRIANDL